LVVSESVCVTFWIDLSIWKKRARAGILRARVCSYAHPARSRVQSCCALKMYLSSLDSVRECECKIWDRSEYLKKKRASAGILRARVCSHAARSRFVHLRWIVSGRMCVKCGIDLSILKQRARAGIMRARVCSHARFGCLHLRWIVSGSVCVKIGIDLSILKKRILCMSFPVV
jgi:hypothetical protein